ncbi:hypothetical protein DaDZ19_50740 [Dickeya ananatis]
MLFSGMSCDGKRADDNKWHIIERVSGKPPVQAAFSVFPDVYLHE